MSPSNGELSLHPRKMLTFFVGFVALALAQLPQQQVPLEMAQHAALMNVYEGVGKYSFVFTLYFLMDSA
jgi:hypothetical protein